MSDLLAVKPTLAIRRPRADQPVASGRDRPNVGLWMASAAQAVFLLASIVIIAGNWSDQFAAGLLAAITSLSFIFAVIVLLRRGWFATAMLLLFVVQPVLTVYIGHVLGSADPMWPRIFTNSMMRAPISILFAHIEFMILCILVATALLPARPRFRLAMPIMNGIGVAMAWVLCGTFTVLVLGTAITTTRGDYVTDVQGGDRFVMVIGPLLIGIGAGVGLVFSNYAMKLLALFCLFAALLIALSGYRSVFVFAATAFASALLARRRLSWAAMLAGIIGIFAAYEIMTYLALLRAHGLSVKDIISGSASLPSLNEQSSSNKAGMAEQIAVFTAYYAQKSSPYYGLTYLYAFVRTLPNALYNAIYVPPRIQDILVEGGPIQFKQVGLNLGAYFFAESILNFGAVLGAGMSAVVVAVLAWVENGRMRSVYRQMVYPGLVMLMPVLALYGSANFVKQSLTLLVVLFLLNIIGVQRLSVTAKVKARTSTTTKPVTP